MAFEDKRTWAEIDFARLDENYREVRRILPDGCRFAGLCKANSYGHGAVPVARRLEELGAEYIAVSCYEEAADLRQAGVTADILILAPSPVFLAENIADLGCTQTIGDMAAARGMSARLAGSGKTLRCHLKLETGMGRTGFAVRSGEEMREALAALKLPGLEWTGVFTHFAVADEPGSDFTLGQFERFRAAVRELEEESGRTLGIKHCANSGAVVNFRQTCLDMVRPGLLLYGLYPGAERGGMDLRPVMSVKTRVAEITHHRAGDTISYGRTFTCGRDMRLAVIPIGYADGLLRCLSGRLSVSINGRRARQVGTICMDMCMVDVTDLPDVKTGDIVTVFGDDPPAGELAESAGTIAYELLCAVSPRVPRIYLNE